MVTPALVANEDEEFDGVTAAPLLLLLPLLLLADADADVECPVFDVSSLDALAFVPPPLLLFPS